MNCKTCTHWKLRGSPLQAHGFGTCELESDMFRRVRCFSPHAPCNKDAHVMAATRTINKRDKELAGVRR